MAVTPDPRTHVTPDAFQVSPKLLGWPLASPSRRFVAILVDLVVVGILTLLGWRVLGLLVATAFFGMAVRRPPPTARGRAFRWSGGCLGALILFVIVISTGQVAQRLLSNLGDREVELAEGESFDAVDGGSNVPGVASLLSSLGTLAEFRGASTAEEAEAAAVSLVREGLRMGGSLTDMRALLTDLADDDADWDVEAVIDGAIRSVRGDEPAETLDDIPVTQALSDYADMLSQPDSAVDPDRRRALESRILVAVATDSLDALEAAVGDLRQDLDRADSRNEQLQDELRDAEEGGLFGFLYRMVDRLGLTFGWGALYFAFLLAWFDGLTPGKKLLGIRVRRLDGEPMTWFLAFERSGGYAAGFATGLLGFAQLLWDANRQAIHDRIAGTVVVLDRGQPQTGLSRRIQTPPAPGASDA